MKFWRVRVFYMRPEWCRRSVAGTYRRGLWFTAPSGRSRPLITWGAPIESMYGP